MRVALAAAALVFGFGAAAAEAAPGVPAAVAAGITPWTEAVVSVTDLNASSALLTGPGGWRITGRGAVSPAELAYWHLPSKARGQYLRICAPAATTGCIRYVRFSNGGPQRPIRLAARPWDTGGIFSLMLRTDSVQHMFDAAIRLGWWAESEPYPLAFGGSKLVNVVLTGPHGINYAFYERQSPPFTAFAIHPTSRAFNAMHMVADQPAALAFYRDKLGFGTVFDAPFTDPLAQPTNFSVPPNTKVR